MEKKYFGKDLQPTTFTSLQSAVSELETVDPNKYPANGMQAKTQKVRVAQVGELFATLEHLENPKASAEDRTKLQSRIDQLEIKWFGQDLKH